MMNTESNVSSQKTIDNNVIVLKQKDHKANGNEYKQQIVWRNMIALSLLHLIAFYGFYLGANGHGKWKSIVWFWLMAILSAFGIIIGAHRFWCHRSFKANLSLRILLAILQTMALQNDIYEWCRDHRVHHKYSETDADPHNSKRGFFFAHMGWLLCRKHPDVKEKGKSVDLSDLWADPVVRFQRRFYIPLVIIFWGFIPMFIPIYYFGEHFLLAFTGNCFRYVLVLHQTWLVNSAAHMYGSRPYDKTVSGGENAFTIYAAMGEGYHNYHHTFPWDYSASEYGWGENFNPATAIIDFFAFIGWVRDRKLASKEIIEKRMQRSGDFDVKRIRFNYWLDLMYACIVLTWPVFSIFLLRKFFA